MGSGSSREKKNSGCSKRTATNGAVFQQLEDWKVNWKLDLKDNVKVKDSEIKKCDTCELLNDALESKSEHYDAAGRFSYLHKDKHQANEMPTNVAKGSFYNCRPTHLAQESVNNVKVRLDAAGSVGIIKMGDISGTCFRVGKNKIMTALHIIKLILGKGYTDLGLTGYDIFDSSIMKGNANEDFNQRDTLRYLGNAVVDFSYLNTPHHQENERNIFKLMTVENITKLPFFDNDKDCIILEILPNAKGTPMPPPLNRVEAPKLLEAFHIIGHPDGIKKTFDHVDGFIPQTDDNTLQIQKIKDKSENFLNEHKTNGRKFPFDSMNNINKKDRILFNCTSMKGASGAPGIVVRDGVAYVVTMLLCGFPDWYYDQRSSSFRMDWPNEYRVEQGANMQAIKNEISKINMNLYWELFK